MIGHFFGMCLFYFHRQEQSWIFLDLSVRIVTENSLSSFSEQKKSVIVPAAARKSYLFLIQKKRIRDTAPGKFPFYKQIQKSICNFNFYTGLIFFEK